MILTIHDEAKENLIPLLAKFRDGLARRSYADQYFKSVLFSKAVLLLPEQHILRSQAIIDLLNPTWFNKVVEKNDLLKGIICTGGMSNYIAIVECGEYTIRIKDHDEMSAKLRAIIFKETGNLVICEPLMKYLNEILNNKNLFKDKEKEEKEIITVGFIDDCEDEKVKLTIQELDKLYDKHYVKPHMLEESK